MLTDQARVRLVRRVLDRPDKIMTPEAMADWVLTCVRLAVVLRHPRLSRWYWKADSQRRLPDPANPRTMNEKFFWRKIFDRSSELVTVSDKLKVRDWLKLHRFKIDAPQIVWSGDDPADIPDSVLVGGVVVKTNHGSGTNIFLDAPPVDRAGFNAKLRRLKRKNHGRNRLEWAYFDIPRKIFVEKLIPDINIEFKTYTFGDRIERFVVIYDRTGDMCADVWLPDGAGGWVVSDVTSAVAKRADRPLPAATDEVLRLSRAIGARFDHMRVDVLSNGTQFWFSELTVYSLGGHSPVQGDVPSATINTSWDLTKSWFLSTPQTGWRRIYAARLRRALQG